MFKDRLKQLRTEKNLTQDEFAKKIGYTRTAISAWEIGRNEPAYNDIIKIANFFGISVDYLLGKSNIRNTDKDTPSEEELRFAFHRKYNTEGLTDKEIEDAIEFYKKIKYGDKK